MSDIGTSDSPRGTPEAAGDDGFAEALFAQLSRLRAYVQRRIPARLQALVTPDDILQEIWLDVDRQSGDLEIRRNDALPRWLKTIAKSKIADAVRRERALKRGGGERIVGAQQCNVTSLLDLFEAVAGKERTPSRAVHLADAAHVVRIALSSLSPSRRNAIELRYLEGCSLEVIAERMNRTVPSVSSLLRHGLRDLRRIVGPASKYLSGSSSSDGLSDRR